MKYLSLIAIAIFLSGCWANNLRTSFSVEDPSVKGEKKIAKGSMISTTKDRYWASYCNALEKGGYKVFLPSPSKQNSKESGANKEAKAPAMENSNLTNCESIGRANYTDMRIIGVTSQTSGDIEANKLFWKDGQAFARTLCSDFFRRIARSYAHRENVRKQTNIAGGLITGIMGLAGASPEAVGGTGLSFASAESAFNVYNETFMVTPDLGLMEALVKTVQKTKSQEVDMKSLEHVSDVITHLNEYVYPCTFTGMQALLDQSLNRKLSDFDKANIPIEFNLWSAPGIATLPSYDN